MMKKTKNFVAVATALTMAMSVMAVPSMAVSASELSTVSDTTISGDVNYVNTTVYNVTLPTTSGLTFSLDPQGLTTLDGGSYDNTKTGAIVATGTMEAVNKSSVDLNLSSKFYVEDSTGTLTLVGADGTIDDTKQQIQLIIQSDEKDGSTMEDAVAITSKSSTAPTEYTVFMNGAEYEFKGNKTDGYTYEYKSGESKLKMEIAGSVAKDYDWSAYTGSNAATVKLHAVFKFSDANATTSGSSAIASLNDAGTKVLLSINDEGGITDSAKLTSVKVARGENAAVDVKYNVNSSGNGVVSLASMETAGVTWKSGKVYTFTFVYDGTTYEAVLTAE